jgi:hypothetical protein
MRPKNKFEKNALEATFFHTHTCRSLTLNGQIKYIFENAQRKLKMLRCDECFAVFSGLHTADLGPRHDGKM